MPSNILAFVLTMLLALNIASSRHVPRFADMDEDDKELFRAAYDTPSYDAPYEHDSYEEDDDLKLGKLDLVKDGLWAIKAKLKELKAFDKALFANLLSTKLKVKELMANHFKDLKKHHHHEKPSYDYQGPSYQYASTEYHAPQAQYPVPQQQYAAPQQHVAPLYGHDPYYGH